MGFSLWLFCCFEYLQSSCISFHSCFSLLFVMLHLCSCLASLCSHFPLLWREFWVSLALSLLVFVPSLQLFCISFELAFTWLQPRGPLWAILRQTYDFIKTDNCFFSSTTFYTTIYLSPVYNAASLLSAAYLKPLWTASPGRIRPPCVRYVLISSVVQLYHIHGTP